MLRARCRWRTRCEQLALRSSLRFATCESQSARIIQCASAIAQFVREKQRAFAEQSVLTARCTTAIGCTQHVIEEPNELCLMHSLHIPPILPLTTILCTQDKQTNNPSFVAETATDNTATSFILVLN